MVIGPISRFPGGADTCAWRTHAAVANMARSICKVPADKPVIRYVLVKTIRLTPAGGPATAVEITPRRAPPEWLSIAICKVAVVVGVAVPDTVTLILPLAGTVNDDVVRCVVSTAVMAVVLIA